MELVTRQLRYGVLVFSLNENQANDSEMPQHLGEFIISCGITDRASEAILNSNQYWIKIRKMKHFLASSQLVRRRESLGSKILWERFYILRSKLRVNLNILYTSSPPLFLFVKNLVLFHLLGFKYQIDNYNNKQIGLFLFSN